MNTHASDEDRRIYDKEMCVCTHILICVGKNQNKEYRWVT